MSQRVTENELARMLERLLQDIERHGSDYHHVTPPALLAEARALLRRWRDGCSPGCPPESDPDTAETKGQT